MRIALTGASGILGEALVARARIASCEILPVTRDQLLNKVKLMEAIADVDIVVHAAANTNVEACELDPAACYRDNLLLSEQLAEICFLAGKKLVFISSTGVYGSRQNTPYAEYDVVEPPTHHHRAKHLAESAILTFSPLNLVIRTGWLFGGNEKQPKNFVARRIEEATAAVRAGKFEMASNSLQQGNPTFTDDVADRLFEAIYRGERGIFNAVNSGYASRLEYVQAIVDAAKLPLRIVPAIGDESFKRNARVSNNECARNWRFETLGYASMPAWNESLHRYVVALRTQG